MTPKIQIKNIIENNIDILKENRILLEQIKKESLEKSLLLEISKKISSSLNVQEVLNLIVDLVKQVIPYDAAGIFLVTPQTNRIYPAVLRGYDRFALKKAHLKIGKGLVGVVTREGKGLVCPNVANEPNYLLTRQKTKSELIVPLVVRNKLLGALNLESDRINAFSASDLDLLTAFANHAAIAIENARLYEEVLKNKELEFDLMIARRIQKALLPKALPKIKGYDFATLNIPSRTVSGDLYDLAWLNNGKLGIAIGDVSGKGTSAAILMASMYSTYKSILNEPISAAKRMQRLNEVMCDNVLSGTYATLFYSELEPENHKLIYCNAGHFPPIVVSPNGKTKPLTEGGMILGFVKKAPYLQGELELEVNDVLLLYTDGLIEAKNRKGNFFTLEVVTHLIQRNIQLSAKALKEKILSEIKRFVQKPQFTDDLTFVVIKVTDSK